MYTVSTITEVNGQVKETEVGKYGDKAKAMAAAKRAARTRKDCEVYGPSSICYVGLDTTAVVAW